MYFSFYFNLILFFDISTSVHFAFLLHIKEKRCFYLSCSCFLFFLIYKLKLGYLTFTYFTSIPGLKEGGPPLTQEWSAKGKWVGLAFFSLSSEKQMLSTSCRAPNLTIMSMTAFPSSVFYLYYIPGKWNIILIFMLDEMVSDFIFAFCFSFKLDSYIKGIR